VPIKQVEQQDIQLTQRIRTRIVKNRTALINEIRGLGTAPGGHGTDEVGERGFTSGHMPGLNAEYMTATQTYVIHQKSTCKRGRLLCTSH